MSNPTSYVEEQVRKQFNETQDVANKSVRAWNELMIESSDMAFDVVLKSWNYGRSMRSASEQAMEDALTTQSRLSHEMLRVWQGYVDSTQNIVNKNRK